MKLFNKTIDVQYEGKIYRISIIRKNIKNIYFRYKEHVIVVTAPIFVSEEQIKKSLFKLFPKIIKQKPLKEEAITKDYGSMQEYVFISCWTKESTESIPLWKIYGNNCHGVRLESDTKYICFEGEEGKGSGRSIPGFDLYEALSQCNDTIQKFGGHSMAVGINVKKAQFKFLSDTENSQKSRGEL